MTSTVTTKTVNFLGYTNKTTGVQTLNADSKTTIDFTNTSNNETEKNILNLTDDLIKKLAKKYKKNPSDIFKELGINFTDEQKAKINEYLSDKKSIEAFLQFVSQENLTKEDIVAGIEKLKSMPKTSWLNRVKNVIKTTFTDGIQEAFKLAKSERVYKAEKLSDNMDEIREEREDFSAENVANIGYEATENAEIKENIMHFVTKKDTQNLHLYDESSTMKATNYMSENADKADAYTSNAVELESIQDANKQTKYKGSTIVNVSERMTEAPELKGTMLSVGKKNDMNDEYFDNITDNLFNNPDMQETIDYMVTKKDANGFDKFKASDLNETSNHLLNQIKEYCEKYNLNIQELGDNYNINGSEITRLTQMVTENPEIKDFVTNKLENSAKINIDELIEECHEIVQEKKYAEYKNYQTENKNESDFENKFKAQIEKTKNNQTTKTTYTEETKKIKIDGEYYDRNIVLKVLAKKYGMDGEKVLQSMEKNPEFVEYMKLYSTNKNVLAELINNSNECIAKIKKFKNASCTITPKEMNDLIALCTNSETTDIMTELIERHGASQAIKMIKEAKLHKKLDDAQKLFTTNTLDRKSQKDKFEMLINGQNRSYCA